MDPSQPNITYKDRRTIGEDVRLIAHENSDGSHVIEVYRIHPTGLEEFLGFLTHHTGVPFAREAVSHIAKEIKRRPLSKNSLAWLTCLSYVGLLDIYEE
jgi:hypothetical protein